MVHKPLNDNIGQATVNALFELYKRGEFHELAERIESLLPAAPDILVLHSLLGAARSELGDYEGAIDSYQAALHIKPDFEKLHNSLGIAQLRLQRYDDAMISFRSAIDNNPQFAPAWFNLGIIYEHRRQWHLAADHYEEAIQLDPQHVEALTASGTAAWELGAYDRVAESYRQALAIKSDHIPAWRNLLNFLEQSNQAEALRSTLGKARHAIGEHVVVRLYEGHLADMDGDHARARSMLEALDVDTSDAASTHDERRRVARLTRLCDRLHDVEATMHYATLANRLSQTLSEQMGIHKDAYLEYLDYRQHYFTPENVAGWSTAPSRNQAAKKPAPVFIIGFPRSGTTLLDTILRSHPAIEVAEEVNAVPGVIDELAILSHDHLNYLARLPEDDLERFRALYFDILLQQVQHSDSNARLIDRFANNIIYAGEIHRLFPDAKFIVLLRHPADCVLSCFMQLFYESPMNANFYTLEDAANLYNRVFTLWHQYEQLLDLDVLYVKYEDLINDVEQVGRSILDFIDMPWHPNLLHHEKTAQDRTVIRTASYNQVTRPLYTDARNRWMRYQKYMEPVMPVLGAWIKRYGYAT
ncbi:MAG: sulfotransferase [Pseudomonadales bacterium]